MMNDRRAGGQLQDAAVGLCARCVNVQIVVSERGPTYYLCRLSMTNPAFPRYPRLPVLACAGFAPRDESPR